MVPGTIILDRRTPGGGGGGAPMTLARRRLALGIALDGSGSSATGPASSTSRG